MRTERRSRLQNSPGTREVLQGLGIAAALGVLVFSVFAKPVSAGPIDPTPYRLGMTDKERFEGQIEFGSPPTVAIEQGAAESLGARAYDPVRMNARTVSSFLETISVPATYKAPEPIHERAVWIVRYAGLEQVTAGALGAQPRTLTNLFVFLDATSGQFLFAEWFE